MRDYLAGELGALDLGGALHLAGEIVGHLLGGDGALHPLADELCRLGPAEVSQHQLARQDDRARVDLVQIGVLRRGAVGGLEDGVSGHVVDVAARSDPDATDLRRQGVGHVVAVEVERGDAVELTRAGEYLL